MGEHKNKSIDTNAALGNIVVGNKRRRPKLKLRLGIVALLSLIILIGVALISVTVFDNDQATQSNSKSKSTNPENYRVKVDYTKESKPTDEPVKYTNDPKGSIDFFPGLQQ